MERATEVLEATTTNRKCPQYDALCRICNIPRCTEFCPVKKKRRAKAAIAKLLLVSTIITLDATADPAVALQDHPLDCERGVIYYPSPDAYIQGDTLAP
jgi:hypothetical protein